MNARQRLLELQKQKLLDQQKLQFQNQTTVTNQNYKPNFDNLNSYLPNRKDELDMNKLANIVQPNKNYYEPGQSNVKFSFIIFIY